MHRLISTVKKDNIQEKRNLILHRKDSAPMGILTFNGKKTAQERENALDYAFLLCCKKPTKKGKITRVRESSTI